MQLLWRLFFAELLLDIALHVAIRFLPRMPPFPRGSSKKRGQEIAANALYDGINFHQPVYLSMTVVHDFKCGERLLEAIMTSSRSLPHKRFDAHHARRGSSLKMLAPRHSPGGKCMHVSLFDQQ